MLSEFYINMRPCVPKYSPLSALPILHLRPVRRLRVQTTQREAHSRSERSEQCGHALRNVVRRQAFKVRVWVRVWVRVRVRVRVWVRVWVWVRVRRARVRVRRVRVRIRATRPSRWARV